MKQKSLITSDRVFALVAIIIGAICLVECKRMLPMGQGPFTGDHAMLGLVGGVLIALGLLMMFVLKPAAIKPDFPPKPMMQRLIAIMLVVAVYSVLIPRLGYVLPTAIAGVFLFKLFGTSSWFKCVLISLLCTAGLYLLFVTGLGMNFPRGIFG